MIVYDHLEREITGTTQEIRGLADAIRSVCAGGPHEGSVELAGHLSVQFGQGKVLIRCDPLRVVVRGSPDALTTFAKNLDWLAAQTPTGSLPSPHLHLEYVPNHMFLDPASEPLLISLKFQD